MKQAIMGELLTLKRAVNSILRFYAEATMEEKSAGLFWYHEAHNYAAQLSQRFGINRAQAAGLLAVFSPQAAWSENKRYALTFLTDPDHVLRSRVQVEKAKFIMRFRDEDVIYQALAVTDKAFKSKAFYTNILRPSQANNVTIDRHAVAICLQRPDNVEALDSPRLKLSRNQYLFFEAVYRVAAKKVGILPHQLQAITWVTYRRLRDLKDRDHMEWKPFLKEAV